MTTHTSSATWQELMAQPGIWRDWAPELAEIAPEIRAWIARRSPEHVWLSGAGTSAFIGDILAAGPEGYRPAPTTDIVSAPRNWMSARGHILSVHFGRSGDSSESLGLMDLLDRHRPDADRLNITCNPEGALASRPAPGPGQIRPLLLPPATHDRGFAMTSSFTTMLLAALACLSDFDPSVLPTLADRAEEVLARAEAIDVPRPGRAVFLGAEALTGTARESALKVLELTAGRTATQWDSTLGYRHGPKAGIDAETHVFVMVHPDPHVARYDRDVAAEIRTQFPNIGVTTVGPDCDLAIDATGEPRADAALYVLLAQVLSVRWSAELGLPVDDPFQGKALSRVVSGVTLYPFRP